MTYQLIYRVDLGAAQSPFRVVAQPGGREVGWINRFLDQCCVRGLAWHTLRDYAFALMQFVRWWADRHSTDEVTEQDSPLPPCWTTCVIRPANNPVRLPIPSTPASGLPNVLVRTALSIARP